MIDLTVPQRQSPLAMVFLGLRILRNIGIAQVAIALLFLFRATSGGALIVMPFVVLLLIGAGSALAWWRYTFQLIDGELIVTKGVLRVDRLTVPVDRIQSLAIDQELLHRITGLVKVAVDTAGSEKAEFTIDAIARPVAEELQRLAVISISSNRERHVAAPSAHIEVEQVVFVHGSRRLLRAAVTTWPLAGLIVLGPLFAFGDQFLDQMPAGLPDLDPGGFRWWWVPVGGVVFIALSIALNVIRVMLQDWQLTVRSTPTSLRRTSGLLSRSSKASATARMQVVSSSQNPLQRMAGVRDVQLSTIGDGDISLIGCDDDQFDTLRRLAGSAADDSGRLDRRVHPAEIWLAVRNTTATAILLAGLGALIVGWWAMLELLTIPIVWLTRRRRVRNFRWSLDWELATMSRVIDTSTRQALLRKTNAVHVTQSIFERRRGLGRVALVTAAGTVSVGMIPIDEAHAARDAILFAAETDRRAWM